MEQIGAEPHRTTKKKVSGLRVVVLSGLSGFGAPLVFVTVIVLRKTHRRANASFRRANKRFQHEMARWT